MRLGFVLCGALATIALGACATRLAGDARAGAVAAIAFSLAPLTSVAFTIATPDGPYLLFWCLSLYFAARALADGGRGWWIALGCALGGALLSRMLALALALGIALTAAVRRRTPGVTSGASLAFGAAGLAAAPFVAWNAAHGWETFAFTFIHRQDESGGFSIGRAVTLYLTQLAAYSPGLWIAATILAVRPRGALLGLTAVPLLAVLAVLALFRPVETYWALGPFASLCAMMGVAAVRMSGGARRNWTLAACVPAAALLVLVFSAAFVPGPMYSALAQHAGLRLRNSGPFEIFTFAPLANDVRRIAAREGAAVLTDGYGFSSILDFDAGVAPAVIGYDWQGRESKRWYPSTMQPARALFVDKEPLDQRPDFARRLKAACALLRDGGTLRYAYRDVPPPRILSHVVRGACARRNRHLALGASRVIDYVPLTPSAGRAVAGELRGLAVERMHALGYSIVTTECSPAQSGLRFDVAGIARHTRQVRIYEIKGSRTDFLRDAKWERYLPYCTHFAFVAPAGAIAKWELPRGIGLIEYGSPALASMRRARRYGLTILREDCLRASSPSLRLRDRVDDGRWIALLEAIAFSARPSGAFAPGFELGEGI